MDQLTIWMILFFVIGYFMITIEHVTKINKATVALLMAAVCWLIKFVSSKGIPTSNIELLKDHLAEIAQVVFFLFGALTIVEVITLHRGFNLIANLIRVRSKRILLWVAGVITFILSAILDNLTTTIVMVSLINRLLPEKEDRWLIGGGIVIAANAGGAWTPIGDVTTTMLWIGGQVTTWPIMRDLFFPSVVSMIVSFIAIHFMLKGEIEPQSPQHTSPLEPMGKFIFFLGVLLLLAVPVCKYLTGLPPVMGILFGLGVMWLVTDILHSKYEERSHLRVPAALARVDLSGVLFFLGILLAVGALESAGILHELALWLDKTLDNTTVIAGSIGIASAIVDNVPLVAATMRMYSLDQFATDSTFWKLIAFCTGTGGSILVVGSAAGVAYMGLEKVDFFWYLKRITIPALFGYFAGMAAYLMVG